MLFSEMTEGLASCRGGMRPKGVVRELEPPRLGVCNSMIVDNIVVSKPLDRVRQPGRFQPGKFRHRPNVDIKWIEEDRVLGKKRTSPVPPIKKKKRRGVEPDPRCPEI